MNIQISPLSQTPIYEQIRMQIKEQALSGRLHAGEQLPSIRLMAKDLQVGIITVKRAYDELCQDGILVNLQGRGCFVKELDRETVKKLHLHMLRERLLDIKSFADGVGITKGDLIKELDQLYQGRESN